MAIIPAGVDLAAALAGVDRSSLSDEELIRLAQARQRLAAHVQAQLLADLHAISGRADRSLCRTEQERDEWAQSEVAFAMTWTQNRASGQLILAEQLLERLFQRGSTAEELRPLRAVEALERIGTQAAREVLTALTRGAEGASLTEHARAALARLSPPKKKTP